MHLNSATGNTVRIPSLKTVLPNSDKILLLSQKNFQALDFHALAILILKKTAANITDRFNIYRQCC